MTVAEREVIECARAVADEWLTTRDPAVWLWGRTMTGFVEAVRVLRRERRVKAARKLALAAQRRHGKPSRRRVRAALAVTPTSTSTPRRIGNRWDARHVQYRERARAVEAAVIDAYRAGTKLATIMRDYELRVSDVYWLLARAQVALRQPRTRAPLPGAR